MKANLIRAFPDSRNCSSRDIQQHSDPTRLHSSPPPGDDDTTLTVSNICSVAHNVLCELCAIQKCLGKHFCAINKKVVF
jgi:hypothetical protein